MAYSKEAIIIVLDVGNSMRSNQSCSSILEKAKKCICTIIRRKIFSESKDEIALMLYGDSYPNEERFEFNAAIVQYLQCANWKLLNYVKKIKTTSVSTDFIRAKALLRAINYLQNATRNKDWTSRKILFISNFDDFICSDKKVDQICTKMKKWKIGLNVIRPDAFFVEDFNFEPCHNKRFGKTSISKILREVNGESYSFNDVLLANTYYQIRKIKPATWNANLELERPKYSESLIMPISVYMKVSERRHKVWREVYAHKPEARIEHRFINQMNDELQTVVPDENLISAYQFGTTLIPYSAVDRGRMYYEIGNKGIKILRFTKSVNVQRYLYNGNKVLYVFARKKGVSLKRKRTRNKFQENHELLKHADSMLPAFIQALHDTKMVAIARLAYSYKSLPKIGFLSPKIKKNCQHLIFVELPFVEDLHYLAFPSFDSKLENLPTGEQLDAVDELINAMDMTVPVNSESGEELLKPKSTANPYLQRLFQCLEFRVLNPEKPLPKIAPHIKAIINPIPELLNRAEKPINRIATLFPLKNAESEQYRSFSRNSEEPFKEEPVSDNSVPEEKFVSEMDLTDAVTDKITEVGSINPVRDFQYLISNKVLPFDDVCDQLMYVVFEYLKDDEEYTHLNIYYSKILSICKEFRNTSLKENNCSKYNFFMTNLKNVLLQCEEDLWAKIKSEKIGLISKQELSSSAVSLKQAEMFLASHSVPENVDDCFVIDSIEIKEEEDYDLLDHL